MLRYIVLAWNASDPAKSRIAAELSRRLRARPSGWRVDLDVVGLTVFTIANGNTIEQPYLLARQRGVILGKLFERSYAAGDMPANIQFSGDISETIVETKCRHLLENYWGRYVAFVRQPETHTLWALRDPSGHMPCLTTVMRGIDVYFSRIADCNLLGPTQFTINSKYVLGYTLYGKLLINETGLNEVQEVLPGERIQITVDNSTRSFEWNPLQVAQQNVIEDVSEATIRMREVTRACVHAWATQFPGILLYLSGGLDSSIVLSCLKDVAGKPAVTSLNYYSPGSNTDERRYARIAAEDAKFPLLEWERRSHYSIAPLLDIPLAPWPCWGLKELESGPAERCLAQERHATSVFSGYGGDTLFYCRGELPETIDYVQRRGIGKSLLNVALDAANLHGSCVADVLRKALRYGIFQRPFDIRSLYGLNYQPTLLPHVREQLRRDDSLQHPLFRDRADIPLGKYCHAYGITLGASFAYDPFEHPDDPVDMRPLCSQPLMDLSLQIPVYLLIHGGKDRSIARGAFARDVPHAIINRKTKGGMDEHAKDILGYNLSTARELLLDGFLIREKYLDRESIENSLGGKPTRVKVRSIDIFTYMIVEAWIRSCERLARQDAAA